jgi:hypothetical protein
MVPCQTSKLKGVRFGYGVRFGSKADMCSAQAHVRFVPKADIPAYSMTSSARPINDSGTVTPSALAVLRLMISSTFVACWIGKSAGYARRSALVKKIRES